MAVRVDSPGPVLFRQVRVGKDGLDLRYVENWSLSLDLVILLRTDERRGPEGRERTR